MSDIVDISEVQLLAGLSANPTETEMAILADCLRSATGAVRRFLKYDPLQGSHTEYYPQFDFRRENHGGIWEVNDSEAYIRSISGTLSNELQLSHFPIRSVTSLYVDYDGRAGARSGAFAASTLKTQGVDYWPNYDMVDSSGNKMCRDGIIRSEGAWPDTPGSIKVTYVAGYSLAELHGQDDVVDASPITDAVKTETQRRMLEVYARMKKRLSGFSGPLTSEGLGDYNYSTDSGQLATLIGGMRDILPQTEHKLQEYLRYDLGVM